MFYGSIPGETITFSVNSDMTLGETTHIHTSTINTIQLQNFVPVRLLIRIVHQGVNWCFAKFATHSLLAQRSRLGREAT